jgi:anti-sigma regulatory factor (Ser/Thr protein kinase)
MGPIFRKRLPGALSEVRRLNDDAARFLNLDVASPALIHDIQLVLEEIATNVARHAEPRGGVTLEVELTIEADGVRVRVEDDGAAFDPSAAHDLPADPSSERLWPGGNGLRIVRLTAEDLAYQREEGRNVLTMRVPERGEPEGLR